MNPGTLLGPYELVERLGAGGMGEVYRARDSRLGRDVAVKVIRTDDEASPDRLKRFEEEARAVAALSHPNVLTVFDVGTHDGTPYVVFELLEGETLRSQVERGADGLFTPRPDAKLHLMSDRESPPPGSRPDDTEPAAHARQIEAYRRMSGSERVAVAFRLNAWARRTAEAGIRSRHPDYSEEQVRMALRRVWLGDELTRQAWPDRELVEP